MTAEQEQSAWPRGAPTVGQRATRTRRVSREDIQKFFAAKMNSDKSKPRMVLPTMPRRPRTRRIAMRRLMAFLRDNGGPGQDLGRDRECRGRW